MSEWTKEPWPDRCGWVDGPPSTFDLSAADYARARACVNALAGVEVGMVDTLCGEYVRNCEMLVAQAATIRYLREALQQAKSALDSIWASIGDRLLAKGPLAPKYASSVQNESRAAAVQCRVTLDRLARTAPQPEPEGDPT